MAKTLNELYQEVVNMSDDEKLFFAKKASAELLEHLSQHIDNETAIDIYLGLVACYVAADGTVDYKEYEFFKAVFEGLDLSYDDFFDLIQNNYSSELVEKYDQLIEVAPENIRGDFVMLGLAICSCNDTITPGEAELLERFLF